MTSSELLDLFDAGELDIGDVLEYGVFDLLGGEF